MIVDHPSKLRCDETPIFARTPQNDSVIGADNDNLVFSVRVI